MSKIATTLKKLMPILALTLAVITALLDFSVEMSQIKESEKKELPSEK